MPSAAQANPTTAASGLVLSGDRPADVAAFEASVVDFFVDAAELLGVPKSVAAIYGIVFASPEPLSFADIANRVSFSKGSVSQGIRALRAVGALKEVSTKVDRAELFTPDLEMRQLVQRFIERRLEKQLDTGKSRLKQLHQNVASYSPPDQKVLRQRLLKLSRWHDRTRALLPVAKTFLNLGG